MRPIQSIKEAWHIRTLDRSYLENKVRKNRMVVLGRYGDQYECYLEDFGVTYISGDEVLEPGWELSDHFEIH